jgi:hypothetical protein
MKKITNSDTQMMWSMSGHDKSTIETIITTASVYADALRTLGVSEKDIGASLKTVSENMSELLPTKCGIYSYPHLVEHYHEQFCNPVSEFQTEMETLVKREVA